MNKIFYILCFLLYANTLHAGEILIVNHSDTESFTVNLSNQYPGETDFVNYSDLVINGGTLSSNDCSAIVSRLGHISSIDFSNTSFEGNAIPFTTNDGPGTGTFSDLKNLQIIKFPANLEVIGNYAFSTCSALETVVFGENSQLTAIGVHAFSEATNLTAPVFPESLSLIKEYAFYQCFAITHLAFPLSLTEVEDYAFDSCIGLVDVDAPWDTPITVGAFTFNGAGPAWDDQKEIILHVPYGTADLYRATNWDALTIEEDFGTGVPTETLNASIIDFNYHSKQLTIRSTDDSLFKIMNITGETVKSGVLKDFNFTLDLSYLEQGVYIVNVGKESLKILR